MLITNLDSEIKIHQFIFTSGKGGDYRIVASSAELGNSAMKQIEKNAIIRYYLQPEMEFQDAIKGFPISNDLYAISYVTEAGRDEYNRPERLRAHVLVIDASSLRYVSDYRIFSEYFINKDLFGKLHDISIKKIKLLEKQLARSRELSSKLRYILDLLADEQLAFLLYAIYNKIKTIIIPTSDLVINTIENKSKVTSMDIISTIMALLPYSIKKKLTFSSFVIHGGLEEIDLGFIYIGGVVPREKALIIDLDSGEIAHRGSKPRINSLFYELADLMSDALRKRREHEINSIISLIDGSLDIIEQHRKSGARLIQRIVDQVYEISRGGSS